MKYEIEDFTTVTGWSGTGSVVVHGLNEVEGFIANRLSKSIVFHFPAGSQGESITKTLTPAKDVTNYNNLVFSIWSRENRESNYQKADDCSYKIDLGNGKVFYFRTWNTFSHEVISLADVTEITQIKIIANHNVDDYLVMSYMIAEEPQLPLDIFTSIKELLDSLFTEKHGKGINIGTVSGAAGDSSITFSGNWISRYSVILIDDGVNSETHQLGEGDETGYIFTDAVDGGSLLNDYTDADVYLLFPALVGHFEKKIRLPGYSIWSMIVEPIHRGLNLDLFLDTFTDTGTGQTREGKIITFPVLIDCESRHYELIADMANIVRTALGRNILWVNGRKHDIYFDSPAVEVEPVEGFEIIPKVQYTLNVEVKEVLWQRQILPKAGVAAITVTPQA